MSSDIDLLESEENGPVSAIGETTNPMAESELFG